MPDCDLEPDFEYDAATSAERPPSATFHECTYIFLTVHNTGGTADFVAQFSGIRGVKRDNGDPVEKHTSNLAWETTAEVRQTIGADGRARLVAMMLFRKPVAGWFRIPHLSIWSGVSQPHQMVDWLLVASEPFAPLEFDVQVINETKMTSGSWHVVVDWDSKGEVHDVTAAPKEATPSMQSV